MRGFSADFALTYGPMVGDFFCEGVRVAGHTPGAIPKRGLPPPLGLHICSNFSSEYPPPRDHQIIQPRWGVLDPQMDKGVPMPWVWV